MRIAIRIARTVSFLDSNDNDNNDNDDSKTVHTANGFQAEGDAQKQPRPQIVCHVFIQESRIQGVKLISPDNADASQASPGTPQG